MRWKRALKTLIESCVYVDPHAYMYYLTARRAPGEQTLLEQDEAVDEQQMLHLIDRPDFRREAQA